MNIVSLNSKVDLKDAVRHASDVLRAGGVVLYPTDTLYGLGADALSDEAVAKVQRIKGRNEKKPIHAIVADLVMAEKYAVANDDARLLVHTFWPACAKHSAAGRPGPLTLILKKKPHVNAGIARDIDTFGVRTSDNLFCLALAREFGRPYTTTSANKADLEPQRSVEAILSQLGETSADIDLIIDAGELPRCLPSTVVDVRPGSLAIIREGAIPAPLIWDCLRAEL